MISKEHYDFGVQTGDFVDDPTKYNYWDNILTAFDGDVFKGVDMIHVTGNHELAGDPESTIAKNMFNIESEHHYSVTYGNVYVAVIGYTASKNQTIEDAKWLVEDAAKSNAKWKVVVSHQPPYGTMKQHMTAKTYISIFQKHVTKLVLILCSQDMIMLMQEQIH